MSVINQLLLDLEKRRASGPERSLLPSHVRALPDGDQSSHWGWIAAGGVAVAAISAVSWALLSGFDWTRPRAPAAQASQRGAEVATEKVAAASAGVTANVQPREDGEGARMEAAASRLSFELANLPPPQAEPDTRQPLPTSRVVGRTAAESATRSEPPTAKAERPEPARPPVMVATAKTPAAPAAGKPEIQKEVRQPAPRDLADVEFRKATASLHQGRRAEAQEGFTAALNHFPGHHGARQALVGLLLEGKKYSETESVLQEGLALAPAQTGFAMTLARLQVERGDTAQAAATLRRGLDHAQGNPEYAAFLATLLQRQGRHEEAIEHFQAALRVKPAAGVWWLGIGISLQSANRPAEAQDAYRRARATNSLSPDLAAFADQRIRQLQ